MNKTVLVLAVAIGGCAPRAPQVDVAIQQPNASGGTLYLIEDDDGHLEDTSVHVVGRLVELVRESPQRLGEQGLKIALRMANKCGDAIKIVRAENVELRHGETVEFRPRLPVHYFEKGSGDAYWLRELSGRAGVSFSATPTVLEDERFVELDFKLTLTLPRRARVPGTEFRAGAPDLRTVFRDSGKIKVPIGGSLLLHTETGAGKAYGIIFHVASVKP